MWYAKTAGSKRTTLLPGKRDSSLYHQEISALLRKPNMLIMGIQMMVPFWFINFLSDQLAQSQRH
jgi:hypothetical protein